MLSRVEAPLSEETCSDCVFCGRDHSCRCTFHDAYQARQALLWAGEIDAAQDVLGKVTASNLQEDIRLLAELRQSCAEQKYNEAVRLQDRIDQIGGLGVRWHAAHVVGDSEGADALLRPFDSTEGLPHLLQYMIG